MQDMQGRRNLGCKGAVQVHPRRFWQELKQNSCISYKRQCITTYMHPKIFQPSAGTEKKDPPQKQQAEFSIKNYWQKMIKHSFLPKHNNVEYTFLFNSFYFWWRIIENKIESQSHVCQDHAKRKLVKTVSRTMFVKTKFVKTMFQQHILSTCFVNTICQ